MTPALVVSVLNAIGLSTADSVADKEHIFPRILLHDGAALSDLFFLFSLCPMAGTPATGLQFQTESVAAGSLFASAQAAAMGAGAPGLVQVVGGTVIGLVGAVFAASA